MRGFDARTGALRWTWDPIPWASRTTPRTGAGNAWSTLSVDAERGLVFVPTGSASPDYWGGTRKGDIIFEVMESRVMPRATGKIGRGTLR